MRSWGSGSPRREFLHVDDLADACAFLLRLPNPPDLINVGTGTDVTIRELTEIVAGAVGYPGRIVWDATKPDGQPRRRLDTARARERMGFEAEIPLEQGLERTIEWYRTHGGAARTES